MPLYEYTCDQCHERSELFISGQQQPVCPKCGGEHLHKEFSTFATHSESGKGAGASSHVHSAGCGCCMGPGGACGLN